MTDRLPDGWDAPAMHEDIYRWSSYQPDTLLSAKILCWMTKQDSRPLYVESCILWTHVEKLDHSSLYRIWNLYRHPHEQNCFWMPSVITDSAIPASRDFSSSPNSSAVLDFIDASCWAWQVEDDWEFIDGVVCTDAWLETTGSAFSREQLEGQGHLFFE